MSPDALVPPLLRAMLYTAAALSICLLLRHPLRSWLGATAAYAVWACVPLALLAAVLPSPQADAAMLKIPLLVAMPALSSAHDGASALAASILAVWLSGAALLAVVLWLRQYRFVRSMGPLHTLDNAVWSATHDAGLPASLGLWRPRIVVPSDFNTRYCAAERALVLAHEQLHLRRGDMHANLLAALMLCIGWFNPLMHLAWRAFRLDQELACDAAVLAQHPGKRRSYANAMLKTQFGAGCTPLACHWAAPHPLTQRIAALRGPVKDARRSRWSFAVVLLLAATISTAAWTLQPARIAIPAQPALAAGNAVDFAAMRSPKYIDFTTMRPPKYPVAAFDAGIEGFVELHFDVDPSGVPQHIAVVQSKPAGVFDQAVLDAARQWRLKPAYAHGKAIASTVRVPVKFELDTPEQPSKAADANAGYSASSARSDAPPSNRLADCALPGCAMQETL
ncbi:TonB family protein [Xanthomonas populi]|uniref:Protein TonB n=1 Tax=Xanthomonas populi TaxID=53414 RepID=A0A2S7E8Z5_9XANT|nr:TonB family protein [Xanthomonas populi]PPU86558.1 energy transducer TonB [Xanthomonas populi]